MSNPRVSEEGSGYAVDCHKYNHITTNTDTVVKASPGILVRIVINTDAAGAITVYDNTSASAPVIAVLESGAPHGSYEYGIRCSTGITIKTAAANDLTVVYE